jgi:Spy/CpxP family protein refolding chaperone
MKNFVWMFLTVIGILVATSLYAFPPDDDMPPPEAKGFFMGKMVMDVIDKLDLSQEQREKIKAIHEETMEKTKELRQEMRKNMRVMKEELAIYKSDEKRISEIMEKIKKVGAELFDTHVNTFIKMKKILTPEQFDTFKKEMEKRKDEMREHFRKHHGREPSEQPDTDK